MWRHHRFHSIKYCVPGITTTTTHMMSKTLANDAYVNVAQDICGSCSEESSDVVVLAANYQGRQKYVSRMRDRRTPNSSGRRRRPTRTTAPFKGSCYDCRREGHHATECNFLMKVEQCMAYLGEKSKVGQEKSAKYRQ